MRKHVLTTRMTVRWGDMDAYGHVNNTVYFRYFEQARIEWLENAGFKVDPSSEMAPVIVNAGCTFYQPVNYPADLDIRVFAGELGRSSVMTWYELRLVGAETVLAEGTAKMVWMNPASGKSVPMPEDFRKSVEEQKETK